MSVHIIPVGKTNPRNSAAPMAYYPTAVKRDAIDLDQLSKLIAYNTAATPADCYLIIMALVHTVSHELEQGNIVRLGPLGSFQISVHGNGSVSPEEVGPSNINSASIVFRPGKQLKQMLQQLHYERKK